MVEEKPAKGSKEFRDSENFKRLQSASIDASNS
jgi:hypothetical protein